MENNRNYMVAIGLSIVVLIAWQFFYVTPKMERERADTQQERTVSAEQASPGSDAAIPSATTSDTATPSATAGD